MTLASGKDEMRQRRQGTTRDEKRPGFKEGRRTSDAAPQAAAHRHGHGRLGSLGAQVSCAVVVLAVRTRQVAVEGAGRCGVSCYSQGLVELAIFFKK